MQIFLTILTVLATISGLISLRFLVLWGRQNEAKKLVAQKKYEKLWEQVKKMKIHELFRKAIRARNIIDRMSGIVPERPKFLNLASVTIVAGYITALTYVVMQQKASVDVFLIIFALLMLMALVVLRSMRDTTSSNKSYSHMSLKIRAGLIIIAMVTLLATRIGLGNIELLDQTKKLWILNIVGDAITVLVTYRILRFFYKRSNPAILLLAIILDIITAAMLAFGSLYVGLLGTDRELTILEVWNILWFKCRDGSVYGIDEFFWIMHTTFIPTLLYLSVIFVLSLAKYPATWIIDYLSNAKEADKPHYYTGMVFALISASITALIGTINYLIA